MQQPAVEILLYDENAVPDEVENPLPMPGQSALPEMSMEDWYSLQREDASVAHSINILDTDSDNRIVDRKSDEVQWLYSFGSSQNSS